MSSLAGRDHQAASQDAQRKAVRFPIPVAGPGSAAGTGFKWAFFPRHKRSEEICSLSFEKRHHEPAPGMAKQSAYFRLPVTLALGDVGNFV